VIEGKGPRGGGGSMDQERVGDQGIDMVPKNEQSYY